MNNQSNWNDDVIPAPCVRRFRLDIIRPTTTELVDNIPSGNLSRHNAQEQELHDIIKPTIAPNL
jgi:hypothetical protein